MLQSWTEIFENKREYIYPDGSTFVVYNPEALYVSSHGTHVLSFDDDLSRIYVPKGFIAIKIDVAYELDWVHPPPRVPVNVESISFTDEGNTLSGPWSLSDFFSKG
ncbi:hypothetical protein UFOVP434_33 [uncultured Caudovirales phage]|uniref:Uncharacterized protein n=1 Tax=uncultured Caudovirales phage TaxID=2100421 RepID=A0A6J5M7Q6_9CAUD|nr:hypothetical protein UFOVP434_33 [uncultured Caudovirales phage]